MAHTIKKYSFVKEIVDGKEVVDTDNIPATDIYIARMYPNEATGTGYFKVSKTFVENEAEFNELMAKNHNLFERLRRNQACWMVFDIDIKPDSCHWGKYSNDDIINQLTAGIKFFCDMYEVTALSYDPIVCYVENTQKKQSLHIKYQIPLSSRQEAKMFYDVFVDTVKTSLIPELEALKVMLSTDCITDHRIYGSVKQNLRCLYQSKTGTVAYPLIPYGGSSTKPYDHLMGIYDPTVTFVETSAIQKQYDLANVKGSIDKHTAEEKEDFFKQLVIYEGNALSVKIDLTDVKKVSKYLSAIPNNSDKPQTSKTWRNLAYVLWSLSKLHKRDYLPLFIEWSNLAKERYGDETKQCRRLWEYYDTHNYNVNKCAMSWLIRVASHYVPNDVLTNEAITEVIQSVYNLDLTKVPDIKYCEYTSLDVKRRCLPLEFNVDGKEYKCVVELAGLGLGKTHIVMKYISTVRPLRVLMIGCRKTFGREKYAELKEIVDDAVFYNDPATNKNKLLKYNKLVIQYESLHLLKTILQNQRYDLVIIDELEGCLDCVNQDTNGNNKATNLETLQDIVKYATKVYCADAFLTNRSLAFLQTFAKGTVLIRKNDYVRSNRKAYIVKRIAGGR